MSDDSKHPSTINFYKLRGELQAIADAECSALGDIVRRACYREIQRWKRTQRRADGKPTTARTRGAA